MLQPNKYLITFVLLLVGGVVMASTGGGNKLTSIMINSVEKALGKLTQVQKESIVSIVTAWGRLGDGDIRKLVYILALAWHESRLKPIKEIKAKPGSFIWEKYQKYYWPSGYYGRGYPQLTWKDNYKKMSSVVGADLVKNPDLALQPNIAAIIIVYGMMNGSFTGRKLADYITPEGFDTYNARRTVGAIMVAGKDTAKMIQGHYNAISSAIQSNSL